MKPTILPPSGRDLAIGGLVKLLHTIYPGKPVRVTVEIAQPDRTPKQNAYLWGVPYELLAQVTGYDKEDLHEWACGTYFGWREERCPKTPRNPEGIRSVPVRSTTRNEKGEHDLCSQEDMTAIWALCQRLGANLGVVIPDPDPDYWKTRRAA